MADQSLAALRQLILATDVLNAAEKQYWMDLLPTMNDAQKAQLETILTTQQKNMEEINKKYDDKLEKVAEKYLNTWDSEKAKNARLKRRKEEKVDERESSVKAEEALKDW